ncbi:endonuclease/exonuclease/phosphatase family protein [Glycomyces algeriensis]|uniref:Metal-dependent hydrolase n=1 Tax=Glycomyces algeriensis TaxID=256037 RepID=A0A9W6LHF7_9ACTN|nr:endonuclease/exonuclease/phosphatase family protein [Glycomyces algeriensis]MDA1365033.1 endonuclease/exonuclease/phosphatase family protein [Glycomyces algeriensis]MDR7349906.1 endonuclease/exonuclease/phosphatase family metal-dependent hydrolase [Glycomyces algeriensis]GLI42616.1 metal-dependent hydrolase [Glycomyces algeriensis]
MNDALTAAPEGARNGPHSLLGPVDPPFLHVMTYNLKSASGRAPHSWWKRRPLVKAVLENELPSIICTQEGRYRQLLELREDLDGYDWVHLGRGGGSRSEATAIFWDASRLLPLEYDHLWLSKHPNVIGSRNWGSGTIRMLTWVHLEDRATGRRLYVVDNHFDHRSEKARRKGARILLDTIEPFLDPVIVAGDFNCGPDSATHRALTGGGLADAWEHADERLTPDWATFNRWRSQPTEGPTRMDWILARSSEDCAVEIHRAGVNAYAEGDLTPSDHWPVQALIRLVPRRERTSHRGTRGSH